jgi:hypothetical protein
MLSKDEGTQTHSDLFFNPQTKCCSYIPTLPNYLVGRIIEDLDPALAVGRATVEERLRAGVNVTPLGLDQPPNFQVLYGSSPGTLFGQSRSLRCPHYLEAEGGQCGVWKHRASVCATWHCKYVRGTVGYEFWTALHQLLSTVEKSLSRWCVFELDIGAEALSRLFPPRGRSNGAAGIDARALDGLANPSESRRLWGNWDGREAEFYRECARLVNALDWQDVTAINRAEIQICSRLLCEAYAKLMSDELPERLKVGAIQVTGMDQDSCRITAYNIYDPLSVPKQLIEVLGYFDGRTTGEALDAIAAAEGVTVDSTLVRRLADFGVLVPVAPA